MYEVVLWETIIGAKRKVKQHMLLMEWGASKLYNQKVKQKPKDEDDWGPEIVKTDSLKKEKENAEL